MLTSIDFFFSVQFKILLVLCDRQFLLNHTCSYYTDILFLFKTFLKISFPSAALAEERRILALFTTKR